MSIRVKNTCRNCLNNRRCAHNRKERNTLTTLREMLDKYAIRAGWMRKLADLYLKVISSMIYEGKAHSCSYYKPPEEKESK